MALASTVTFKFHTRYTNPVDLSTPTDEMRQDFSFILDDGDGADEANVIFHDTRTLADGADETLDFYASGSLEDSLGDSLTIETLKVLFIRNNSSDASLLIGAAETVAMGILSDASDILVVPPGGYFFWTAPNATGLDITTNKNLKIAHDGTGSSSLTYDIIAIGVD